MIHPSVRRTDKRTDGDSISMPSRAKILGFGQSGNSGLLKAQTDSEKDPDPAVFGRSGRDEPTTLSCLAAEYPSQSNKSGYFTARTCNVHTVFTRHRQAIR